MKTSVMSWLVGFSLCFAFASNELCSAGDAADLIQAGSTWQDNIGHTLIILERNGGTYRGRFTKNDQFIREVTGSTGGNKISWLAKDVNPIKGGPGGDNFGTITGDKIDFKFTGNDGKIARVGYTLTRVSEENGKPPPVFSVDPNQPLLQTFSQIAPNTSAWVLAPLDQEVPKNIRQNLTYLREDLRDEYKQKPQAGAAVYDLAEKLCSAMITVLDERDQTLLRAGYRAAQADADTNISGDQALAARRNYMMSWPQYRREQDQRRELKSNAVAHAEVMKQGPKIEWSNRAAALRVELDKLYVQFRETLRESATAK